jgi:hypothetical protein
MTGFFQELRRRKVYRVAAAYGVVAWLIIQVDCRIGRGITIIKV